MSNRLTDAGRMPLVPDPLLAARAGVMYSETRLQADRVFALIKPFFELPADLWNVVRGLRESIRGALILRDAVSMSDHVLSDIGLRRDQLPQLYLEGRLAGVMEDARRIRQGAAKS